MPAGQIVSVEAMEIRVTAGTGHHLHQLHAGLERTGQTIGAMIDVQSPPQGRILGGDAGRTVVRVTEAGPDAADRLDRGIRQGDPVGAAGPWP